MLLSVEERLTRGGACTRYENMFVEKKIQNSQLADLNSESNIIFDNNLNNNYLCVLFVTGFTVGFTLTFTPICLKVQVEELRYFVRVNSYGTKLHKKNDRAMIKRYITFRLCFDLRTTPIGPICRRG